MAVFTKTAQISNTTSAAGIYTARFTATDDHGRTAFVDVPVTLLEPLTIETPYSLAAYRNVPYTFTLTSNACISVMTLILRLTETKRLYYVILFVILTQ